jgi:hypothetical protein
LPPADLVVLAAEWADGVSEQRIRKNRAPKVNKQFREGLLSWEVAFGFAANSELLSAYSQSKNNVVKAFV